MRRDVEPVVEVEAVGRVPLHSRVQVDLRRARFDVGVESDELVEFVARCYALPPAAVADWLVRVRYVDDGPPSRPEIAPVEDIIDRRFAASLD